MKNPKMKITALACMIMFIASGCKSTDVSNLVTIKDKQATINVWEQSDDVSENMLDNTSKRFMQKYLNVKIKLTKFSDKDLTNLEENKIKAKDKPDIIFTESKNIGEMSHYKLIRPLDNFVSAALWDKLYYKAVSAVKYNKNMWMVPGEFSNLQCLAYKPKEVKSAMYGFNNIIQISKNPPAKYKGKKMFAFGSSMDCFLGVFNAFEGNIFDKKGNIVFKSKEMIQTLAYMKWLYKSCGLSTNSNDLSSAFKKGSLLAAIGNYGDIIKNKDQDVAYALLPFVEPASNGFRPFFEVKGFAVTADKMKSNKAKIIKDFISFNLEKDVQIEFVTGKGYIGVLDATMEDVENDTEKRNLLYQLEQSVPAHVDMRMSVVYKIIDEHFQKVLSGKETPSVAVINMGKEYGVYQHQGK